MSTGGQKRTRSERVAALELPPGRWERAWSSLRRRDVLLRIGLCGVTALALTVVIRAWHPPLGYRSGWVLSRDLVGRQPFQTVAQVTEAMRDRARRQVRYVYAHDPEPLIHLRKALRNTVLEVLAANTYSDLNPEVWADFQPQREDASSLSRRILQERFEHFRSALGGDENLAGFEKAVAEALAPFEQRGLLQKLPQEPGEGNQDEIVVYPVGQPDARKTVKVSDVLIGDAAGIRESLRRHVPSYEVADCVFDWIRRHLTDTLSPDEAETKKAIETAVAAVDRVVVDYAAGQTLAAAGDSLRVEQIELLRLEHEAAVSQSSLIHRCYRAAAVFGVIVVLFGVCGLYLHHREQRLMVSLKRLIVILTFAVLTVWLARWAAADTWRAEIVPLLLFGETVAIAYRQELALLFSGVIAIVVVLGLGFGLGGLLLLLGVTATAILQLARIRSRSKLLYVGCFAGLAAFLMTFGVRILQDQPVGWTLLREACRYGLWTLAAGFLMTGLLPFIERLFGVVTDVSLLELGDVSHPLLQEMVQRAPSTYSHSITVGAIAEAAADAIGARGLLVRIGAYFHDIGKVLKPEYFIENQPPDANRHESLIPAMSTLVIVAHVKDGADLARKHKLPKAIIDFVEQHHGTTLVEYFYGRATQQREEDPDGPEVDEASFRYPGPRPQTKEAAVLMLADAAESACRALVDPAPARITSLVRELAERKLDDGQFDESNLTLRELRAMENSMIKSLIANYHGRVKYPDQRRA